MEENTGKLAWFFITLAILLIAVSTMIIAFSSARKGAQTVINDFNNETGNLLESKYTEYDGQDIWGNQVISLLDQFRGQEICLEVVSKTNTNCYNYTDSSLSTQSTLNTADCNSKTSSQYIDQGSMWNVSLTRNANNAIVKMTFTQK